MSIDDDRRSSDVEAALAPLRKAVQEQVSYYGSGHAIDALY